MRFTVTKFAKPMKEMLTTAETQAIFSNLAQLLELHARLSSALPQPDARAAQHGSQRSLFTPTARGGRATYATMSLEDKGRAIARAFIEHQPYFKTYAQYCANYPYVAGALGNALDDNAAVATFLSGAELTHSVALTALLFRPVQRMCVYPLLFQQALKHAPAGHALHADFEQAFEVTQQTVTSVNEQVRAHAPAPYPGRRGSVRGGHSRAMRKPSAHRHPLGPDAVAGPCTGGADAHDQVAHHRSGRRAAARDVARAIAHTRLRVPSRDETLDERRARGLRRRQSERRGRLAAALGAPRFSRAASDRRLLFMGCAWQVQVDPLYRRADGLPAAPLW
jgi:hypothetical protein